MFLNGTPVLERDSAPAWLVGTVERHVLTPPYDECRRDDGEPDEHHRQVAGVVLAEGEQPAEHQQEDSDANCQNDWGE
jgi:hypothetical protein